MADGDEVDITGLSGLALVTKGCESDMRGTSKLNVSLGSARDKIGRGAG